MSRNEHEPRKPESKKLTRRQALLATPLLAGAAALAASETAHAADPNNPNSPLYRGYHVDTKPVPEKPGVISIEVTGNTPSETIVLPNGMSLRRGELIAQTTGGGALYQAEIVAADGSSTGINTALHFHNGTVTSEIQLPDATFKRIKRGE